MLNMLYVQHNGKLIYTDKSITKKIQTH